MAEIQEKKQAKRKKKNKIKNKENIPLPSNKFKKIYKSLLYSSNKMTYFKINYKTREVLNHNESQIMPEKAQLIDSLKNQILETIQKYFGEFTYMYETAPEQKMKRNTSYSQGFIGISAALTMNQKKRNSTPHKFSLFYRREEENLETTTHNLTIRLKAHSSILQSDEAKPAIDEITEILEAQKKLDKDSEIKYGLREL